jgi:hypothetical protein
MILVIIGATWTLRLNAQQQKAKPEKPDAACPLTKKHGHDMAEMNKRGDQGMGFSQEKTTHHFYLTKTGGIIQVEANDGKDTASRDQIREHLGHIAMMFAEGNFDIPMFVHDQVPPGVDEMKRLKTALSYKYEETERGGRVIISSDNPQAVSAVHNFLRFQITEHTTGDSLEISWGSEPEVPVSQHHCLKVA